MLITNDKQDPKKLDQFYMQKALDLAYKAAQAGEVPVGAIIVYQQQIIARAYNQVEMLKDATAHAEMIAITQAETYLKDWRLTQATLYVNKEPCPMCAGAMINCRLGRVVYGCPDPRMGAAGTALNITGFSGMLHKVEVTANILKEESLYIIQQFFQKRRKENKESKSNDKT